MCIEKNSYEFFRQFSSMGSVFQNGNKLTIQEAVHVYSTLLSIVVY